MVTELCEFGRYSRLIAVKGIKANLLLTASKSHAAHKQKGEIRSCLGNRTRDQYPNL